MQYQERFQKNIARKCGVNADKALLLVKAGYARLNDLRAASDEELLVIEGIGPSIVKKVRKALGGGE